MFPSLQQASPFPYETDKIQENYSQLARYKNLFKYRKLSLSIILRIFLNLVFSKARKSGLKVENSMTLSDFLNGYTLVSSIHDILYAHILPSVFLKKYVMHKKRL